ncbi:TIGR03885 family FMN-dependent LLM class oxidoreductase [Nannocystis punicea]|uniref:TIGR03885 family FMN-dependent LLM class oxidoreductase n=1 Tax=Nannocystis punicea TaxID=2995304 RepID=A0ABY7GYR4_9BACT|nr:TIGR03885 family FMN-dependent LLM class oxidoreductase [Nannocystis poenicansa]WAS92042.1 TIGR03885 family FMN-dependent LLM class oxidoreductase [Nannocystis poenicansa]
MKLAYHCSHEQFAPGALLALARRAEAAGFDAATCSDHFHPWSERQGHSGHAWTWLGAALQATGLGFGVVTAPGQRYHPAVLAQAVATLLELFPGRFWLAIGSGERLNEGITGEPWPVKERRNARLRECADVMRALWAGETVTHRGLVRVDAAKLYTRPRERPLLFGAAVTAETARWLGSWADGLITVAQADEAHAEVIAAFREGGGAGKSVHLKVQLAYAASEAAALRGAWEQWRTNVFASDVLAELRTPAQFEAAAAFVTPEAIRGPVRVAADPSRHREWLARDAELDVDLLSLHHVGGEQERFIEAFGAHVLPQLRAR